MTKRKSLSAEFKREQTSQKQPADLAPRPRELGIRRRSQLYKWQDQLSRRGDSAFPGSGQESGGKDELARLRKELEKIKEERDILRKSAAYLPRSTRLSQFTTKSFASPVCAKA
jgi:transposase